MLVRLHELLQYLVMIQHHGGHQLLKLQGHGRGGVAFMTQGIAILGPDPSSYLANSGIRGRELLL